MRILNLGGFANADVLAVPARSGRPLVVKDYARRSWLVRRTVAPLLVWHERAMLERARGLPGVPDPGPAIDSLAVSMERIDGAPLRRRAFGRALPTAFFDALEGILDGLAVRGVAHLDLRSPTNVLVTASGAPALIDLASAVAVPLPFGWLRRAALAKLRRRFEAPAGQAAPEAREPDPALELDLGAVRLRVRDGGRPEDPVPGLWVPDAGLTSAVFSRQLECAGEMSRRALALDPPGVGGSRGPARSLDVGTLARWLERLLDALRVRRVDVVGLGWGGLAARALAVQSPDRVRSLVTVDLPSGRMGGALLERWREARSDPEALRARLERELPSGLDADARAELTESLRGAPATHLAAPYRRLRVRRLAPLQPRRPPEIALDEAELPLQPWLQVETGGGVAHEEPLHHWPDALRDPERIWKALAELGV